MYSFSGSTRNLICAGLTTISRFPSPGLSPKMPYSPRSSVRPYGGDCHFDLLRPRPSIFKFLLARLMQHCDVNSNHRFARVVHYLPCDDSGTHQTKQGCITLNLGMIAGVSLHQSNPRRLQRRTIGCADHSSTYAAITLRFWFLCLDPGPRSGRIDCRRPISL